MGDSKIIVEFNGNLESLFNRAIRDSKNYNALIEGNAFSGKFEARALGLFFKGNYNVIGNKINIVLSEKPFFISTKKIESTIQNYINLK